MKNLFKYIALALIAPMLIVGCTTDYPELDPSQRPSAEDIQVDIVVDQTTNYVTFTLLNKGWVPMFIFNDQLVDGKANKTYAYAQNGISLRFREAGEYSVEVKAYNSHGISEGSIMKTFTLDNTYRDPFDATPYMNALANTWQWDQSVKGHFGCGSIDAETGRATTDGTDWWSCDPDGKVDMGLYDDTLTFTADGKYIFDPGDAGTVYVNWGTNGYANFGEYWDGTENDFQVPMEGFETTYTIENNWNEAGIEEIYLVLPEGKNLSYIPHATAMNAPRYRFLETNVGSIRKTLSLVNEAPTENGGGGIAWKYQFVPFVHVAGPEELLAGTDAAGKVWIMDADAQGHLGCGDSVGNPAGWWSAPAQDKASTGLYDDEITFTPDGKYIYNPGPDGLMYINWGVTAIGPNPGAEPDIDIEWPLTESTYTFDDSTITLAANTPMVYVPSDFVWENPVFHVTEITETKLVVVAENPGCYWQMIFKARDVKAPEVTFDGMDISAGPVELTLSQGQDIAVTGVKLEEIWVDPDFFSLVNDSTLKFLAVDGDYRVQWDGKWFKVVPMYNGEKATYSNGGAVWVIGDGGGKPTVDSPIGWATGEAPLPFAKINDNTYRITLAMKAEGGSIKLFEQPDWGNDDTGERVWLTNRYNSFTGNGFFKLNESSGNIETDGAEPGYYTFFFTDNDGVYDMEVKKAKFGDTTIYDPAWEGNMWLSMTVEEMFYHYQPGWAELINDQFGFEENGTNDYTVTLPVATNERWQAQFAFRTNMISSADKTYDFYAVLNSNADHPSVTIKLVKTGDDGVFYFEGMHKLTAYEDYVYKVPNMAGIDMEKISLFFDFGGNVENTVINIKDILFQEHREEE